MCQAVGGKGQITGLPEAGRCAQASPVPSPAMSSCQEDSDTQKALLDCLGPRVGGKTKTNRELGGSTWVFLKPVDLQEISPPRFVMYIIGGLFIYLFIYFSRQVLVFGFLVLCFPVSLISCFVASLLLCFFLLLCFSASLLLCFSLSLLLCFSAFLLFAFPASLLFSFSVFPVSLLLYFCAFLILLFYFFFSSVMCFCCSTSCSFASLLPVSSGLYCLFVFHFLCFILFCLYPK